jgi:3-methyladenine DNA glycosylase AlkC
MAALRERGMFTFLPAMAVLTILPGIRLAEPLKTFFSPALVRRLAADIARVEPSFAAHVFARRASAGLASLELLDRARSIADALADHLPQDYGRAVEILLRSLGPEHEGDELIGAGMEPFYYLPHTLFVVARGLDHFDLSMRAQYQLTKRFSAEGSIRAFIAREPERTLGVLRGWARDPNAHVRRLVSEGTRLRLPWAPRVAWLDAHPEDVLGLLELLKDDPTTLVRRSVANNLNDLGKVHSDLLARTCAEWLVDASAERRALIEHALRSAVKRGEPDALRLLGYGGEPAVAVEQVRLVPARVAIGGRVTLSVVLRSTSAETQELLVDAAVHFVKASGKSAPKVFKLDRVSLPAQGEVRLRTGISLAVHTTRTPHPGVHRVDLIVNGRSYPVGSFRVTGGLRSSRP